jgi:hypothetical protein
MNCAGNIDTGESSMIRKSPSVLRRRVAHGVLLLMLLPSIGCVNSGTPSVNVQGYVYLNGAPVTGGTIIFAGGQGYPVGAFSATIGTDGFYAIPNVPVAMTSVYLVNPQAPQPGVIPAKYAPDGNAGLTANVDGNGDPETFYFYLTP